MGENTGEMTKKTGQTIASKTQKDHARADVPRSAVARELSPTAKAINGAVKECISPKPRKRSRAIDSMNTDHPYWIFLSSFNLNRVFLSSFQYVSYRNFSQFRIHPAKFVTIVDLLMVQGLTGVSVGEQWDLLMSGYEYNEHGTQVKG